LLCRLNILLTSVNLEAIGVSTVFAQHKRFDAKSGSFQGYVLHERQPSLPKKQRFINRNILGWCVHFLELLKQVVNERSQLVAGAIRAISLK